jgi:hypothetical protein
MEFFLIFPEKTINDAKKEGTKGEKKVLTEKSEQKKQQVQALLASMPTIIESVRQKLLTRDSKRMENSNQAVDRKEYGEEEEMKKEKDKEAGLERKKGKGKGKGKRKGKIGEGEDEEGEGEGEGDGGEEDEEKEKIDEEDEEEDGEKMNEEEEEDGDTEDGDGAGVAVVEGKKVKKKRGSYKSHGFLPILYSFF